MSTVHLKVKIKSLAVEAHIIRKEEKKALLRHRRKVAKAAETAGLTLNPCYCSEYEQLYRHRQGVVGSEARVSLLAYGFLRGRAYAAMEFKVDDGNAPDWKRVKTLATRFGEARFDEAAWSAWLSAAEAHLKSLEPGAGSLEPAAPSVAHG